jgi:CHAT domain-containing protein
MGATVGRDLAGGEAHTYRLHLAAGEYLYLIVEQKGIDVAVALDGPDGKAVCEVDSPNGSQGPEPVYYISEAGGDYVLRIASFEKGSAPARYEVVVRDKRPATERDRERIVAVDLYAEAENYRLEQKVESNRKAVEKYLAAADQWHVVGEPEGEIDSLVNASDLLKLLGESPAAAKAALRAIELAESTHDTNRLAIAYGLLGEVYLSRGDRKAMAAMQKCIELNVASDNTGNLGVALFNLGLTYAAFGEASEALETYARALEYNRRVDDKKGAASTLNAIGYAHLLVSEDQLALESFLEALPLAVEARSAFAQESITSNIGTAYSNLGDDEKALEYFNAALELARKNGYLREEAIVVANIGKVYARRGERTKAIANFESALETFEKVGDHARAGMILSSLAGECAVAGAHAAAIAWAQRLLALPQPTDKVPVLTTCCLAFVYAKAGETQKALDLYAAVDFGAINLNRAGYLGALEQCAAVEREAGRLDAARRHVEMALPYVESLRARSTREDFRFAKAEIAHRLYTILIDVLMALEAREPGKGHAAEALRVSERARARDLLEAIALDRANELQGVSKSLTDRRTAVRRELQAKLDYQIRVEGENAPASEREAVRREVEALEEQYRAVEGKIREASPAYAALTAPEPLEAAAIRGEVGKDTGLVEYALGERRSYVWAVTAEGVTSAELPARDQIEALALRARTALVARACAPKHESSDERSARLGAADAEYASASAELSRMVLAPVAKAIAGKRVAVVADGALQLVPFAALPDPQEKGYLIEHHEIESLPSATTLEAQRRQAGGRASAPKAVAIVADPVFDAADPRVSKEVARAGAKPQLEQLFGKVRGPCGEERAGLERLEGSRREAGAIAALVPKDERLEAEDFAANLELATGGELSKYRIVHIATHGYVPAEAPELAGLVLTLVDEMGKERQGYLGLPQVYGLRLPAELVVLSACETGLGKQVRGEGLVGLVRGFMYAGARRVVASQWKVDDAATAELMTGFYRGMLVNKESTGEALRAAQLRMVREGKAPFYWAAFQLHGDWR